MCIEPWYVSRDIWRKCISTLLTFMCVCVCQQCVQWWGVCDGDVCMYVCNGGVCMCNGGVCMCRWVDVSGSMPYLSTICCSLYAMGY